MFYKKNFQPKNLNSNSKVLKLEIREISKLNDHDKQLLLKKKKKKNQQQENRK
jgi:hypothetical protein